MAIEDQFRDEKLRYDIKERLQKYQLYHRVILISMNIFLVKKYCLLINSK